MYIISFERLRTRPSSSLAQPMGALVCLLHHRSSAQVSPRTAVGAAIVQTSLYEEDQLTGARLRDHERYVARFTAALAGHVKFECFVDDLYYSELCDADGLSDETHSSQYVCKIRNVVAELVCRLGLLARLEQQGHTATVRMEDSPVYENVALFIQVQKFKTSRNNVHYSLLQQEDITPFYTTLIGIVAEWMNAYELALTTAGADGNSVSLTGTSPRYVLFGPANKDVALC